MSWISGIAGRAEEFLNKIDNNAAAILKKESKTPLSMENHNSDLHEVKSDLINKPRGHKSASGQRQRLVLPVVQKANNTKMAVGLASHSSPNLSSREEEEHLIEYLNDSSAVDIDRLQIAASEEPLVNGHAERSACETGEDVKELSKENQMLRNEIRSLNGELTLLLQRTKTAERDLKMYEGKCFKMENEVEQLGKEISDLKENLKSSEKQCQELENENLRLRETSGHPEDNRKTENRHVDSKYCDRQTEINRREDALKAEILALQARYEKAESDLALLQSKSTAEVSDINGRLSQARHELEIYRTRAQRTLSEKDKLISELRKLGSSGCDVISDITICELEQLRNEKGTLTEECEDLRLKLESAYDQVADAERRVDAIKEEASKELKTIQIKLTDETARRLAAEDHCNAHAEELHAVREELSRQVGHLSERVRAREAELSRLRGQIAMGQSSSHHHHGIHDRITSLTSALVTKQASLEQVSKERNELRLELDQTKNKFREYMTQVQGRTISVNDTDDAKLQVPSFLLESPFDTSVTRRVKRAYSTLDAVSVRTGVFLRRYPLARIFFLCYVIFLHFWVCLVLFSHTPETRL